MDREVVLAVLATVVCGPLLAASGLVPAPASKFESGREAEARRWRTLWAALLPAGIAFAVLVGWAVQEPDACDERFRPFVYLVVAPFALVWSRAIVRALVSLRVPPGVRAATVGLLRPRVVVAPHFERSLDLAARAAVRAHEEAHAKHRDPLRLWLAAFATDLAGPLGAARARLDAWRSALEVARDEEARAEGIDGADLAAAVIEAARGPATAGAGLTGDGAALQDRVVRLLAPLPPAVVGRRSAPLAAWALVFAVAGAVGVLWGDAIVQALPGVVR